MVLHEDELSFAIPNFSGGGALTVAKVRPERPHAESASHLAFDPALQSIDVTRPDQVTRQLAATVARELYIRDFGFAMLTAECADALSILLRGLPTLEVGAGSGYLSAALARRGVAIVASDLGSERAARFGIARVHRRDHEGDSLSQLPGDFGAILMSWPDGRFARNVAAQLVPGQLLVYQGEGLRGRTADNEFFRRVGDPAAFVELHEDGALLDRHHLRFCGMCDAWHVYRRL